MVFLFTTMVDVGWRKAWDNALFARASRSIIMTFIFFNGVKETTFEVALPTKARNTPPYLIKKEKKSHRKKSGLSGGPAEK